MIRIAIICPSEIAFRRFLPALIKCDDFEYVGVAAANEIEWFGEDYEKTTAELRRKILQKELEKAEKFQEEYGGVVVTGYEELIENEKIDAVYIPLPPALHYKWAKKALECGKHVLVEKPATTSKQLTSELVQFARTKNLALHENYMFIFHQQLKDINQIVADGRIGEIRTIRIDFGFPRRSESDFRYVKELGGGALLDCGGYTLKYAAMLLGDDTRIDCAALNYIDEFDADLYGSATLSNQQGQVVQVSFGMDNQYKCELEIWGSEGRLISGRILTAPAGYEPTCTIITGNTQEEIKLSPDDTFMKSLQYFSACVECGQKRDESYGMIQRQSALVDEFSRMVKRYE